MNAQKQKPNNRIFIVSFDAENEDGEFEGYYTLWFSGDEDITIQDVERQLARDGEVWDPESLTISAGFSNWPADEFEELVHELEFEAEEAEEAEELDEFKFDRPTKVLPRPWPTDDLSDGL